jgi:hypothetical protein
MAQAKRRAQATPPVTPATQSKSNEPKQTKEQRLRLSRLARLQVKEVIAVTDDDLCPQALTMDGYGADVLCDKPGWRKVKSPYSKGPVPLCTRHKTYDPGHDAAFNDLQGQPWSVIERRNDQLHAEATKAYLEAPPRSQQKLLKEQAFERDVRNRFDRLPKTSRKYESQQLVLRLLKLCNRYETWTVSVALAHAKEIIQAVNQIRERKAAAEAQAKGAVA